MAPPPRPKTPTPGPNAPPTSVPSSPDHLCSALPPPSVSRSPTRSPSRSVGRRSRTRSPGKNTQQQHSNIITTTANQLSPNKFVTSTIFTPSRGVTTSGTGAGGVANSYTTGGGTVRLGVGEAVIPGGTEESWRIRVVVEAEREEGGRGGGGGGGSQEFNLKIEEAGAVAARGRGRGRGRGSSSKTGRSATPKAPRMRKATPAGRGRGTRGIVDGDEDDDEVEDEDEDVPVVIVKKKRTVTATTSTTTPRATAQVAGAGRGRTRTVTTRIPVRDAETSDDGDAVDPFLEIAAEEERSFGKGKDKAPTVPKPRRVITPAAAVVKNILAEKISMETSARRTRKVAITTSTTTGTNLASEESAAVVVRKARSPAKPRAKKIVSLDLTGEEDGESIEITQPSNSNDTHQEDDPFKNSHKGSEVVISKTRTITSGVIAAHASSGITVGKRITATSTALGRLRTSTAASDAIRARRRGEVPRERNVTPRERVGSVVSLDSPTFSSPNTSASPLLVPKTRQQSSNHPITTATTCSTTPADTLNRQRIASNNQTATPPASSPPPRRPKDSLNDLRGGSRISRRSKSPALVGGSSAVVVEASGSVTGEISRQSVVSGVDDDDDGEDSGIYWADFAADGAENSDSYDEGGGDEDSRPGQVTGATAATNQTTKQSSNINVKTSSAQNVLTTPAPWQLPTPSTTQNQAHTQQNATTTETIGPSGETDIDWLPTSPIKHPGIQHHRTGSIASTHSNIAWPDTEEGEGDGEGEDEAGSVVHQRVSSVDSVNYFPQIDTDGGGSESQPGSVRRSSVVTTNFSSSVGGKSNAKPRRRIMDILPADYESRRTLFDGVVPPRAESPEAVASRAGGGEGEVEGEVIKPKRKGKRKSVGFAGAVEIPTKVPAMATSCLVNEDVTEEIDSITPTTATPAFPSSPPVPPPPPPPQQEEQAKPQTPGNTTGTQFLPELFVPKRRYMEIVKQQVAGRRAPDLARCRVASVVLQRAILGELGGRDGGGIPREFGGYLVRVDENAIEIAGSSSLIKGKERAVDVEEVVEVAAVAGEVGVGVGVVGRTIPVQVPSVRNTLLARSTGLGSVRSTSPTGEVSYPILPARRMISGLGRPTTTLTTTPITTTISGVSSGGASPVPPRLRKTAMATPNRAYASSGVTSAPASAIYTSASGNSTTASTTRASSTSAAVAITNTLAHARAFSGASGRGGGSGGGSGGVGGSGGGGFQTPMKEKDLRASLLETLARSRRKLGMRRSVTPPSRSSPTTIATIITTETTTTQQAHRAESVVSPERGKNEEEEKKYSESREKGKERERETETPDKDVVVEEAEVDKQRDEAEGEQSEIIDVLVQEQLMIEERASMEREEEKVVVVAADKGKNKERKKRSTSPEKASTRESSMAPEIIPPANILPPATPATKSRSSRRRTRVETDNLLAPPAARVTRSMTRSSVEDLSTPTPALPSAEERAIAARVTTMSIRQSKSATPSSESLPDATPVPVRRGRGALGARGLTLEERWEAERIENVRRAREMGVVVINDDDEEGVMGEAVHVGIQRKAAVAEDDQEFEEMEEDMRHEMEEQMEEEIVEEEGEQIEDRIIVRRYTPVEEANVQRYTEAEMVDESEAEASSSSEDPDQNTRPMIFRRKGLLRTPRVTATSSMESVILHTQPAQLPRYPHEIVQLDEDEDVEEDMEYTVDAEEKIDDEASSSEDSALDEPMVFPRRGLHRPGAMPAVGVYLVPTTPIRRPLGRVPAFCGSGSARTRGRGMGVLGRGQPAWTPRDLRIGDYEEMISESQGISYSYEEGTGEAEGYEEDGEGGVEEDGDVSEMEETGNNDTPGPISAASAATTESRPGIAARLFGGWLSGSGRPARADDGDPGFQELLPAELAGRVAHAHQGHDGSRGGDWALNEQSSNNMFTTSRLSGYSRTRPEQLEEESDFEAEVDEEEEASRQHRQLLRPATVWLPRHWELLDALMQDVPHPSAPVTPPRAAARYEVFKRNRLRELESSNPSRSPAPPSPSLASSSQQPQASSSNQPGLEQQDQPVQPTPITLFRVPLLNWRIKYTPYSRISPRRQHLQQSSSSSPQAESNWRNDPIMELDEREIVVVDWFVQEARERFDGEDWGGTEGREMVEKMVRCWGLRRERDRRGEKGIAFSGVGREEKRRLYYGGLRI